MGWAGEVGPRATGSRTQSLSQRGKQGMGTKLLVIMFLFQVSTK